MFGKPMYACGCDWSGMCDEHREGDVRGTYPEAVRRIEHEARETALLERNVREVERHVEWFERRVTVATSDRREWWAEAKKAMRFRSLFDGSMSYFPGITLAHWNVRVRDQQDAVRRLADITAWLARARKALS